MREQHRTEILSGPAWVLDDLSPLLGEDRTKYRVRCSCGYIGRPMDTRRQAEDDESEHIRLT